MLDPFYSAELLRETAAGIPNARLTLDDGTGHAMLGKDFQGELLRFLSADDIAPLGPRRRRPDLPRLVLAGRTVARPAHTVDDSAGRRTDVPGKSKA